MAQEQVTNVPALVAPNAETQDSKEHDSVDDVLQALSVPEASSEGNDESAAVVESVDNLPLIDTEATGSVQSVPAIAPEAVVPDSETKNETKIESGAVAPIESSTVASEPPEISSTPVPVVPVAPGSDVAVTPAPAE